MTWEVKADVRLCKLGVVDSLLNKCIGRYFFSPLEQKKQSSKKKKKKITPDLRLTQQLTLRQQTLNVTIGFFSILFRSAKREGSG